jgi:hypothetical protein
MQHGWIEVRILFLLGSHMPRCESPPLSPPQSCSRTCPTRPSIPPSHDDSQLQEAVRVCSAGFASPLLTPHVAFSKVIRYGRTWTCGISPMGPAHTRPYILSVDRRYFFDCISPSVQMHHAETDLSLAAVLQLHVWIRKRSKFSSLLFNV